MRLVELLKRHEGKTLEYKRDLSSPESVLKCLVAFANTGGGIVVIGVEDGSKNVRGVPDVLAAEEKLANLVSDSIRPRLVPDIEVVPWRNLNVLAVQVYPSNTRPHYLERLGPQDGVFIRVGSTNRKADALQIDELKRLNWMNSFDEQAIPDLHVGSHRLPSCFRVVCALQANDRPGMDHSAHRHGAPRPSGADYRRTASFRQGQVRPVPGCLDPGGALCRNESNTSTGFSRDPLVPASRRGRSDYIFT